MHNFYKYLIGMLIACFCWQTSFANDETLPSGKNKSQPKEQPSTGVSAEVSAENIVGKKASLEAQIELEKAMQSLNLQNVSAQKVTLTKTLNQQNTSSFIRHLKTVIYTLVDNPHR